MSELDSYSLPRWRILTSLFNSAIRPPNQPEMVFEQNQAEELLASRDRNGGPVGHTKYYFDMLLGRKMEIDIEPARIDVSNYDKANGRGCGFEAIFTALMEEHHAQYEHRLAGATRTSQRLSATLQYAGQHIADRVRELSAYRKIDPAERPVLDLAHEEVYLRALLDPNRGTFGIHRNNHFF